MDTTQKMLNSYICQLKSSLHFIGVIPETNICEKRAKCE